MADQQLDSIRQYCDTTGKRLSRADKELLCTILENPEQYDGYTSQVYTESSSGKDFKGRWEATTSHQYRINIGTNLSIDSRYKHECDDGVIYDKQWNSPRRITDTKEIIEKLCEIRDHDATFMTPEVVKENGIFDVADEEPEELCADAEADDSINPDYIPSYDSANSSSEDENVLGKLILGLGGLALLIGTIWAAPKIKKGWDEKVKPQLKEKWNKLTGKAEQAEPESEGED